MLRLSSKLKRIDKSAKIIDSVSKCESLDEIPLSTKAIIESEYCNFGLREKINHCSRYGILELEQEETQM